MLLRTKRKHKTFVSGLSARLRTTAAWSTSWPSWIWRQWSYRAFRWGSLFLQLEVYYIPVKFLWIKAALWGSARWIKHYYSGDSQSESCRGQDAIPYQVGHNRIKLKCDNFNFVTELTGTRSSVRTRRWTRWRRGRGRTPSSWKTCPASGEITFHVSFQFMENWFLWTCIVCKVCQL